MEEFSDQYWAATPLSDQAESFPLQQPAGCTPDTTDSHTTCGHIVTDACFNTVTHMYLFTSQHFLKAVLGKIFG